MGLSKLLEKLYRKLLSMTISFAIDVYEIKEAKLVPHVPFLRLDFFMFEYKKIYSNLDQFETFNINLKNLKTLDINLFRIFHKNKLGKFFVRNFTL